MKGHLLILLFLIFSTTSYCQEKASLTKEETVNYLKKKLNNIEGYAGSNTYVNSCSISSGDNCKIDYRVESSNMVLAEVKSRSFEDVGLIKTSLKISFDLTLVKEIQDLGGNESVGKIKVILTSSSGKQQVVKNEVIKLRRNGADEYERVYPDAPEFALYYKKTVEKLNENSFSNYVYLYYLKADDSNFSKIKKAFDYLIALCKAEDDPFGN